MSSSLDWSQPITRAEESLELKWDDDDDDENKSDDDQSQKPLEMKVNPTSLVEQSNDGKCLYTTYLGYGKCSSKLVYPNSYLCKL
jgi:hypothetical protein